MKKMRLMMAAAAGIAAMAVTAHAEEPKPTFTGNVALVSDYAFRGLSQTEVAPAVQGGFDYGYGSFYAGTWASSVDFKDLGLDASLELDLYAGLKFPLGPVGMDVGVIGYYYPNAKEAKGGFGEADYYEGYVKGSVPLGDKVTVGAAAYYSPEFTLETGTATYFEGNAAFTVSPALSFSGAIGVQDIEDVNGIAAGTPGDNYTTWNLGGTVSAYGFSFDLRYVDTSIEKADPFITTAYTTVQRSDGRGIFTIKRAF